MTTTTGRSRRRRGGRELVIPTQALIIRFRITLQETDPVVLRMIKVPGDLTFWDLHVAIQDAMGWLDYHLHRFTVLARTAQVLPALGYKGFTCCSRLRWFVVYSVSVRLYVSN